MGTNSNFFMFVVITLGLSYHFIREHETIIPILLFQTHSSWTIEFKKGVGTIEIILSLKRKLELVFEKSRLH